MMDDERLSARAEAFLQALDELSAQYGIKIAVSMYDGIDLWDRDEHDEAIHSAGIRDMTKDGA